RSGRPRYWQGRSFKSYHSRNRRREEYLNVDDAVYDLAITGGTVVLPEGPVRTNIGARQGLIARLSPDARMARKTIYPAGRLVLPGGVDSHCHMDQQPWDGRSH